MEAITTNLLTTNLADKLSRGVDYISKFSIYPYTVRNDYNSAQCCLATLFYLLVQGDLEGFLAVIVLSEQLAQTKSAYIKVWIIEDFKFKQKDVLSALRTFARMFPLRNIFSRSPIADLMTGLEKKYNLEGFLLKTVVGLTVHPLTAKNSEATGLNVEEKLTSGGLTTFHNKRQTEIVKSLLEKGANVTDEDKGQSLLQAAKAGYSNIVSLLVYSGADVKYKDQYRNSSLHLATLRGHLECVKVLLDSAGVDINITGEEDLTALQCAITEGDAEIVKLFLEKGTGVTDEDKGYSLLEAVEFGHSDIVSLLVSSGADIGYKNLEGDSSLHQAALSGYLECVEVLLDSAGVDVNIRGEHNRTALHCASGEGHTEIVKLLLGKNADVNLIDDKRNTPLHYAAENGDPTVADLLISSGADINAINNERKTPLDLAVPTKKTALINLLRSKSAIT